VEGFVSGEWAVAPTRNLLVRGDEQVRVEPRVMDVLVYLAARVGEVVSKEELVEHVWEGRHVTDDVLTVTVYALRKALGDEARRPRYIETVSRRGYRWIAPVEVAETLETVAPLPAEALPAEPPPAKFPLAESRQPRRSAWRGIAAAVVLALLAAGAAWMRTLPHHSRHVPAAEAYEAYVKGRHHLDQRRLQSLAQAREQFDRAVALDPQYPAAQAGIADTYSAMADFGVASPAEMRPPAMKAARRALELDPQSAEGYAALGRAQFLFDWDFAAAEHSLERSLSLDDDYMPAYQTMAWLQSARGHHAQAIAAARRALQLDPVNTARYTELAWVLALDRRYDEALREVDRALQLSPRSFELHLGKGSVHEMAGQPDAAFAAYREALVLRGLPESALRRIDAVYRAEGLPGYYRGWLNRTGGGMPLSETWRAQLYVRAGELDRAIEALEHAYQRREGALAWVNVEPSFQVLRSNARFQQIAAHVGRN
jgi:DNA-binding winged helix-turn-helix (wHTH) protein/tetratricopeptide (TPR) repeat protein